MHRGVARPSYQPDNSAVGKKASKLTEQEGGRDHAPEGFWELRGHSTATSPASKQQVEDPGC